MLQGRQVAYFHPGPLGFFSLAVLPPAGMSFGPSVFRTGVDCAVSAHWPHEERVRWEAVGAEARLEHDAPRYQAPYAMHEIEYVNRRWGSEFRFLAKYRLRLDAEGDWSEGRRIVRAFMQRCDPKEKVEVEVEVEGKSGHYLLPDRGRVRHVRLASAPRMPSFTQGW